ncbi:Vi polysaccharide ABC transporter ATP-binding protein VexC [Salmonella enterica]|nr:Vi polysaccharide ABC transporter ATP-binding protein VexC [Salmonella enterica]EDE9382008.1 Vi polysaccharide ABC transporter ATP-binding protein VexC [Salmonella enterica subsp. enterica serovar Enteritidis]EKA9975730.1 Vi polysaccharide ABC transporter ATP-binding protein VexC [Salmonella enterica subsp. enterica]EAU1634933.1 Vi polysaccharide ABC transporter ATP-binding protein VexC [Salmonella enterica]EAW6170258.1 Vi polysaccharide ABC transporter ATP-binding protein VexC [Salmonella e
MFGLVNCTRYFDTAEGPQVVFDRVSFVMNYHDHVGILAAPGSGKTTLSRMLCGVDAPDEGDFLGHRGDALPLGGNTFILPGLTGEENARMMASLYGLDGDEFSHFCYQLTQLEGRFSDKVSEYSVTMKAHLAFAINLLLPCRLYIADDKLYTGDSFSQQRMHRALARELRQKGLVVLTRNPRLIKEHCHAFGVLLHGKIIMCSSLKQATGLFERHLSSQAITEIDDSSFDI